MKNYVQPGETISVTAPYAVSSGGGVVVGSIFGVAVTDAESGAAVEVTTEGVFDLAKTSAEAWTQGAKVYAIPATGVLTTTATSNTLVGVAVEAAANPSSTGRVRLNGSF